MSMGSYRIFETVSNAPLLRVVAEAIQTRLATGILEVSQNGEITASPNFKQWGSQSVSLLRMYYEDLEDREYYIIELAVEVGRGAFALVSDITRKQILTIIDRAASGHWENVINGVERYSPPSSEVTYSKYGTAWVITPLDVEDYTIELAVTWRKLPASVFWPRNYWVSRYFSHDDQSKLETLQDVADLQIESLKNLFEQICYQLECLDTAAEISRMNRALGDLDALKNETVNLMNKLNLWKGNHE